jgi:hypothetical protein
LFAGYLEQRQPGESFSRFCVRTPDDALMALGHGTAGTAAAALTDLADA